jgi:hypothetical protein
MNFQLRLIHAARSGGKRPPKRSKLLCSLILAVIICEGAAAADFGLVLSPEAEYVSDAAGEGFGFTGSLTPWFSAALGGKMGLYLSGKAAFEYEYESDEWAWPLVFELERTELNFRPIPALYLILGRQRYRDSGGMIAAGLFDGLSGSFSLGPARLSLGAFYTGFLYKETAKILMTPGDTENYSKSLDYGDPDTYFASRRILVPLDLEFSDLASRLSLALTLLGQFDVNDAPARHTQYLATRFGVEALDSLRFNLTGIGALAEDEGEDALVHFAAAFGADWDLPGALTDMLTAEFRWGSGMVNDAVGSFRPVSGIPQGTVFTPGLEGLMNIRAVYTARPHRIVSLSAEGVVFWRTDEETFRDAELDGALKDRFLGTELSGALIVAPQSALRLTAGGGAFFPGNAFAEDADIRWKITMGIILSL